MNQDLKSKLSILPGEPGCYLMKNKRNQIIYVGKAKNLKSRINQYFTGSHDYKVTKMVSEIVDFEYFITRNEKEALLLEINLIKKHQPRYNVIFTDDKTYPYIKITSEKYPRLLVVRDRKKDPKAHYFGPYPDVYSARKTADLLNKIFPFRKCNVIPKKLCLYYHIGQCLGPCVFDIDPAIYEKMTQDAIKVLNGDVSDLVKQQTALMLAASEATNYEKAQEHRELITALNHISTKQTVTFTKAIETDVVNYFYDKGYLSIQILHLRQGRLSGRYSNLVPLYEPLKDALESIISQYYKLHPYPKEIIVPSIITKEHFSEEIGKRLFTPLKGDKVKLLEMALENAESTLNEKFLVVSKSVADQAEAMATLNHLLGKEISTIEVFDISHIAGAHNVAGMVVYQDGEPLKSAYRRYKLKEQNSDVDSLKEVIYRRYLRLLKEAAPLPDLIVVDGGILQINAVTAVLADLNLPIEVVGLAKDRRHETALLLDRDGEEIPLVKDEPLFFFLANLQDEVHRYSIAYHRLKRRKAQTASELEVIEGIGPARRQKLLKHFKTIDALKEASKNELLAVVPENVAENIINYFQK